MYRDKKLGLLVCTGNVGSPVELHVIVRLVYTSLHAESENRICVDIILKTRGPRRSGKSVFVAGGHGRRGGISCGINFDRKKMSVFLIAKREFTGCMFIIFYFFISRACAFPRSG